MSRPDPRYLMLAQGSGRLTQHRPNLGSNPGPRPRQAWNGRDPPRLPDPKATGRQPVDERACWWHVASSIVLLVAVGVAAWYFMRSRPRHCDAWPGRLRIRLKSVSHDRSVRQSVEELGG